MRNELKVVAGFHTATGVGMETDAHQLYDSISAGTMQLARELRELARMKYGKKSRSLNGVFVPNRSDQSLLL